MFQAGVRVPKPYLVIKNVLAMEFIGDEFNKAPLLVDVQEVTNEMYQDLISQIRTLVTIARLVHGDLSEYNIMVKDEVPYIIDVGQATPLDEEGASELLIRDLYNLTRFFSSRGIEVIPVEELLSSLTSSTLG